MGEEPAAQVSVVLAGIAAAVEQPAEGALVILSLQSSVDPAFLDQLATMIRSRELATVRFVVIGPASAKLEAWANKLGEERMWFHRLEPAGNAPIVRTLQALDAEEEIGPGFRGAWPVGAKPPPWPRRRARSRLAPAGSAADEPDPFAAQEPEADEEAEFEHELSLLVRRAAAEMQQGRGPEALRCQTRARELCTERRMHERAIDMQLMLGGYLLRLEQPRLAADAFGKADEAGFEHQEYERAAKAQLNRAIALQVDGDTVAAIAAYRRTIETAKGVADAPAVVIEAYRRAGEVALGEGLEIDCIGLWGDAVAYARDLEPQRRGEGVRDLATRLSALLVRHRRYSQAREIDRIAAEF